MTSALPTLAFFGATGECAGKALALSLKAGYTASALVRTPAKLRTMLETNFGVPADIIDQNLTIIQGSVRDIAPVKETLAPSKRPASIVISGLGSPPKLHFALNPVTLEDTTLCEDGINVVIEALRELRIEGTISQEQRPLVLTVSTTGTTKTRDVPILYLPFYHILLAVPHRDKRAMENAITRAAAETGPDAPVGGFVILRATLLFGAERGVDAVRSGWHKHPDAPSVGSPGQGTPPAIGYSISKADVGAWIFTEVVKKGMEWSGRCVSITY